MLNLLKNSIGAAPGLFVLMATYSQISTSALGDAHIHGITAWPRLGEASGGYLDQPPAQAGPPTARSQHHAQVAFKYLQGWKLHSPSGQPDVS